ncbi:hypothetical protein C4K88_03935 [Arthrobacter pityocampae]|uniref:Flavin-nucleotide-binding protein n=1 Tax=Arthrobacter pityocampae TaxID=547334 RepID=A0A2S5IZ92_9MICC|nr:pyridoxamine 5'-phosphate oxidase family protein [Arthrobacter pityocampae]PPB49851.1 hypothetical protein C4K88_03935 [Arthrobacter pityocampae]
MEPGVASAELLPARESWRLLRHAPFGRLSLCAQKNPSIVPVNFLLDRGTIVFHGPAGMTAGCGEGVAVAFEADGFLEGGAVAWSVIVSGHASTISPRNDLEDAAQLPAGPVEQAGPAGLYASDRESRLMCLVPETISGRAFAPQHAPHPTQVARADDE